MSAAGKAGLTYFAGMFALGFVLGTARVLLIAPVLGAWGATFAELPVMLAISWLYCAWLLRRFAVPGAAGARLLMGAVAFILLMVAEVLLGIGLFGRDLPQQVQEMTNGPGLAGLAGQLAFAAFPLLRLGRPRRNLLLAGAGLAAVGIAIGARDYTDAVRMAEARLAGRSALVATSQGRMEYAVAGAGTPILMIHGTGGGFDQGLSFTEGLLPYGFQVIAPSRFGYLRSDFPADPSSANQADAYVDLLDRLGIARIVVAGGSAGALSAAQFALRHPDRCAGLIMIVPAANVRGADPVTMTGTQEFAVRRLTTSNLLFWAASRLARDRMIETLLATDPALVRNASASERARAHRILDEIIPIEPRSRGMLNDALLAGNPARIDFSRIRAPTLVISAEDDRFGTAATARDIAAAAPGAKLLIFPDGGHIWVGHDQQLWRAVAGFLRGIETRAGLAQRLAIREER